MAKKTVKKITQELNDEIHQDIHIYKDFVEYKIYHSGELVTELKSPRPYKLGMPNDGTIRNCLMTTLCVYLGYKQYMLGFDTEITEEEDKVMADMGNVGRMEGAVMPEDMSELGTEEFKKLLRESLIDAGLDKFAVLV